MTNAINKFGKCEVPNISLCFEYVKFPTIDKYTKNDNLMNEDVLKDSLISCYMRNRTKNYTVLANLFDQQYGQVPTCLVHFTPIYEKTDCIYGVVNKFPD